MNLSRLSTVCAASVFAGVVAVAGSGVASAQGGAQDVRTSGSCSAGSVWKMKAKPDHGLIQLELEVDSNRVGQNWSVVVTDNKVRVFSGNRTTLAPSGSFSIGLHSANRAGTDSFVGNAHNARTGETCAAHVRL